MAIDHALLDRAEQDGTAVLRLYCWAGGSISFGANEAALSHWDRELIERRAVPCVRRPTGGRAVWHDADDLTYAVTGALAGFGGLKPAYQEIHARFARRLADIGLATTRSGPRPHAGIGGRCLFRCRRGRRDPPRGKEGDRQCPGDSGVRLPQHGAIARAHRLPALNRFRRNPPGEPDQPTLADLPPVPQLAAALLGDWLDQVPCLPRAS